MKTKSVLKSLLFIAALFVGAVLNAQEAKDQTYVITSNGSVSNVQPYIDALNNSDMRYHRLKNTRTVITFDTGVTVQLFSATEMLAAGRSVNLADYPESFDADRDMPAFSLGPDNIIMEMHHLKFKQY